MQRAFRSRRLLRAGALAALVVGAAFPSTAQAARPFETAVMGGGAFSGSQAGVAFSRTRGSGAGAVKLFLSWSATAPRRPADPTNPNDPAYAWGAFDEQIRLASQHRLRPIAMVAYAPAWASGDGGWAQPDPGELAQFARAAATRYSGYFDPRSTPGFPYYDQPLPRIRYWQVWNEPNLIYYLSPQYQGGRLVAAERYRAMVNLFSNAVKGVNSTNLVLAGGTGPFKRTQNSAPLAFMREFLCLNSRLRPRAGCGPARFDIWGHHPYTSGGPTHRALRRDDVSLGNLPSMARVLRAAAKHRKIVSRGSVRFWVDEFSWDTSPPDPKAIPSALHARWTAEAMYRMWKSGVTLIAWLQLMDNRFTGACGDPYQSGLYFHASSIGRAKAKRSRAAFRFPFVALREGRYIRLWGRTPLSVSGSVVIERQTRGRWQRVVGLRAGSNGVFTKRILRSWRSGFLRARKGTTKSLPFSVAYVADRFYDPFGVRPAGNCGNRVSARAALP